MKFRAVSVILPISLLLLTPHVAEADAWAAYHFTGFGRYYAQPNDVRIDFTIPATRDMFNAGEPTYPVNYYFIEAIPNNSAVVFHETGLEEIQRVDLGHTSSDVALFYAYSTGNGSPTYQTYDDLGDPTATGWAGVNLTSHVHINGDGTTYSQYDLNGQSYPAATINIGIYSITDTEMGVCSKPGATAPSMNLRNAWVGINGTNYTYPEFDPSGAYYLWSLHDTYTPENDGFGATGQCDNMPYLGYNNATVQTHKP